MVPNLLSHQFALFEFNFHEESAKIISYKIINQFFNTKIDKLISNEKIMSYGLELQTFGSDRSNRITKLVHDSA